MVPCSGAAVAIVLLGCADMEIQMERISTGIRLHQPGTALWITGTPAEAIWMGNAINDTVCLEMESTNTADNAVKMLRQLPPSTKEVWVVTSEFHMPRTQRIFELVWGATGWKRLYVSVPHDGRERELAELEARHMAHWREDVEKAVAN
jgi:hypothetical protein